MANKAITKSVPVDDVVKIECSACKEVLNCPSEALFQCAGDGCERQFCESCAAKMPTSNTCEDCGCDHKSPAPGVNEYADGCMECDCDCMCDSMPSMVICKVCQRIAKRTEEEEDKKRLEDEADTEEDEEPARWRPQDLFPGCDVFSVADLDASMKRTGKPNQKFTETMKEIQEFRKSQTAPSTRGTKRSSDALSSSSSSSSAQSPSKKARPAKQGSKKVA